MSNQSYSEKLYLELKKMIRDGIVPIYDKMPTESELGIRFKVGRSTVREAIRMLQANGFVKVWHGSGTYVESRTGNVAKNISELLVEQNDSIHDYMDTRIAFETLAVQLFIKRGDSKLMQSIEDAECEFAQAVKKGDVGGMTRLDERFHYEIVKGTNNDLLINICDILNNYFRRYREITFLNEEHRSAAIQSHNEILGAIFRRDTNDAVYYVKRHLITSIENALEQATQQEAKANA